MRRTSAVPGLTVQSAISYRNRRVTTPWPSGLRARRHSDVGRARARRPEHHGRSAASATASSRPPPLGQGACRSRWAEAARQGRGASGQSTPSQPEQPTPGTGPPAERCSSESWNSPSRYASSRERQAIVLAFLHHRGRDSRARERLQ